MVIYEMEKLPYEMDNIGMKIYNLSLILNTGKWVHGRVVDSTTKGGQTSMPIDIFPFVLVVDALAMCTIQGCSQSMQRGNQTRSYQQGIPLL